MKVKPQAWLSTLVQSFLGLARDMLDYISGVGSPVDVEDASHLHRYMVVGALAKCQEVCLCTKDSAVTW